MLRDPVCFCSDVLQEVPTTETLPGCISVGKGESIKVRELVFVT